MPSHDRISRLFRLFDPEQFGSAFGRFMASFSEACEGLVAIGGKVLRRSFDRAGGRSPPHMVSVWVCEQRMVLAQVAMDAKSSEITAIPAPLKLLKLKGTLVTADVLNCQRAVAQKIVDGDGDYCLSLKGNQGTLHDDVRRYPDDPESETIAMKAAVDGDHGWPRLKAIGKVVRRREIGGKTSTETVYDLLSLPSRPSA